MLPSSYVSMFKCTFCILCYMANFGLDLHAVRALAFGVLWITLGKRVWFFPNILAEEATLKELFQFWPQKDEGERPKWTARLFFAVVAVLVVLLLRHHAPDEAARARYWLSFFIYPQFFSQLSKNSLCLIAKFVALRGRKQITSKCQCLISNLNGLFPKSF